MDFVLKRQHIKESSGILLTFSFIHFCSGSTGTVLMRLCNLCYELRTDIEAFTQEIHSIDKLSDIKITVTMLAQ